MAGEFRRRAARAVEDRALENNLRMVARRHGGTRRETLAELGNLEQLRRRLNAIKEEVLSRHAELLAQLTAQVQALGGTVHRAADAAAAREIIGGIAAAAGARVIVKGKSMTGEEVGLNPTLISRGFEVFETDLGEYIIQLAGQRPSHIVLPAIHMTKAEIAALFHDKLGMPLTDDAEALTKMAREVLREKFLAADVGITGANALVAENGLVMLVENEGNIRLSTTLPRVHVALVGIEKIVPRLDDLAVLLKLLPRNATGQKMSGYVSFIRGGRQGAERDGAREFHLVLLDNGRSRMMADPVLREALKCIRCGACLNNCPVYQHVGGHAYGSAYPGPIGAMITRALGTGDADDWFLPFASTLCGACTEACPARIPIHQILIDLRRRAAEAGMAGAGEGLAFGAWGQAWSRPAGYRLSNAAARVGGRMLAEDGMIKKLPTPFDGWTKVRDLPAPAARPFRAEWREPAFAGRNAAAIAAPGSPLDDEAAPIAEQPLRVDAPRPGDPARFARELALRKAAVIECAGADEARTALARLLKDFAGASLVRWDHPELAALGVDELASAAGVTVAAGAELKPVAAAAVVGITAVDGASAATGTMLLFTGAGTERSISLLPPAHIALLKRDKIFADTEDLVALARARGADFRGLTLITGPSMTGDIELIPVLGVHGPGRVVVIVY